MILQALKLLHNLSVSYLNYLLEKHLSRLEREEVYSRASTWRGLKAEVLSFLKQYSTSQSRD